MEMKVKYKMILALILALALAVCMGSCGKKDAEETADTSADTQTEEAAEEKPAEELPEVVKTIEGVDENIGDREPLQIDTITLYADGSVAIVPLDDLRKNEIKDDAEAVYPFEESGKVEDVAVADYGNGGRRGKGRGAGGPVDAGRAGLRQRRARALPGDLSCMAPLLRRPRGDLHGGRRLDPPARGGQGRLYRDRS